MMKFTEQDAGFPEAGNCYIVSQEELEIYPLKKWVEDNIYGQVENQFGYCNGNNSQVHEDRMDLVDKGTYLYVIGDNSPIKVL